MAKKKSPFRLSPGSKLAADIEKGRKIAADMKKAGKKEVPVIFHDHDAPVEVFEYIGPKSRRPKSQKPS